MLFIGQKSAQGFHSKLVLGPRPAKRRSIWGLWCCADLPHFSRGKPSCVGMVLTLDPQKDASAYTRTHKGKIFREAPRSPPGVWIQKEQRAPSGCHQPIPMQSEGCYSQLPRCRLGRGGGSEQDGPTKPSCLGQKPLQSSLLENC